MAAPVRRLSDSRSPADASIVFSNVESSADRIVAASMLDVARAATATRLPALVTTSTKSLDAGTIAVTGTLISAGDGAARATVRRPAAGIIAQSISVAAAA